MCKVGNRTSAGQRRCSTPIQDPLPANVRGNTWRCVESGSNGHNKGVHKYTYLAVVVGTLEELSIARRTTSKSTCVHDCGIPCLLSAPGLRLVNAFAFLTLHPAVPSHCGLMRFAKRDSSRASVRYFAYRIS